MKALALSLIVLAVIVAGCGGTRTVRVPDQRAKIRDNVSTPAQVRSNFAGQPSNREDQGGGITCDYYGSPQRVLNGGGPAWVIRLCYRGLPE